MGRAVPAPQPGADRRAPAGAGGGARGGPQPVRGRAQPRREQAQDLPAARRQDPACFHVYHATEVRDLLLAGESRIEMFLFLNLLSCQLMLILLTVYKGSISAL